MVLAQLAGTTKVCTLPVKLKVWVFPNGGGQFTMVTCWLVVAEQPWLSVVVKVMVYVPATDQVLLAVAPVAVAGVPEPKVQA
jgi:hypothetical protein